MPQMRLFGMNVSLNYLKPIALALISSAVLCCEDCHREGCDYTHAPVGDTYIVSGIAGGASYQTDVVANGCAECLFIESDLSIWSLVEPIDNVDRVVEVFYCVDPDISFFFNGTYEHTFDPGDYLVCTGWVYDSYPVCASLAIHENEVVTVHVITLYGPNKLAVFGSGETVPRQEEVYRWESDMSDVALPSCMESR